MIINFVRGDSFSFKFSIKNNQGDNITTEDLEVIDTMLEERKKNFIDEDFEETEENSEENIEEN